MNDRMKSILNSMHIYFMASGIEGLVFICDRPIVVIQTFYRALSIIPDSNNRLVKCVILEKRFTTLSNMPLCSNNSVQHT
jgi:hypothetical protein